MITKWATSIANKLAELSGEDVSADQLEIYIYVSDRTEHTKPLQRLRQL